jgi:hypothetical protein
MIISGLLSQSWLYRLSEIHTMHKTDSRNHNMHHIYTVSDFLQHDFDTSRVTHASVIEPVVRLEPLPNVRKFTPAVRLPDKG